MKRISTSRLSWIFRLLAFCLPLLPLFCFAATTAAGDWTQSMNFTPPRTDLSVAYLEAIFGTVGSVLSGTGTQIFGNMIGLFNSAVLTIGGGIVTYVLVVSTVLTAHEGEILGNEQHRWSSIWIPLRTLVGLGLMLPKTSGYSTIQVFVMWLVVQGVGAADSIWNTVLDYLHSGGSIISVPADNSGNFNNSKNQLTDLFKAQVCMYGLQDALDKDYQNRVALGQTPPPVPRFALLTVPMASATNAMHIPVITDPNYSRYDGFCGSVTWSSNPQNLPVAGLQLAMLEMDPYAQSVAHNHFIFRDAAPLGQCNPPTGCTSDNFGPANALLVPNLLRDTYDKYYGLFLPYYQAAGFAGSQISDSVYDNAKRVGWILAGKYYYDIAAANRTVSNQVNTFPGVVGPSAQLCSSAAVPPFCSEISDLLTSNAMSNYIISASTYQKPSMVTSSFGTALPTIPTYAAAAILVVPGLAPFYELISIWNAMARVFQAANLASTSQNPLTLVSSIGGDLMDAATFMWLMGAVILGALGFALGAIPCVNVTNGVTVLAAWLIPLASAIFVALFGAGFVLAFYLPLIPFIMFTFAAIGWMFGVIESMVAAPLIAIGMMHPDGPHEALGKSENGFMLLLNVFLRPGLMVVGLVTSIVVSYVGLWIINAGVGSAIGAILDALSGLAFIFFPAGLCVVYTGIAVAFLHRAFSLIHHVPDKILRWISGGQAEQLGSESSGEALQSAKAGAQRTGGTIARGADSGSQALNKKAQEKAAKGKAESDAAGGQQAGVQGSYGGGGGDGSGGSAS